MTVDRRKFLGLTGGGGVLALCAGTGLLPRLAAALTSPLAAGDTRKPFEASTLDAVIKAFGGAASQASGDIDLRAPEIAENGAVVPIEITSKLPGTKLIAIVSEKNPHALSAAFHIPEGTEAWISTRVKIAETSNVVALVQTDKGFFHAERLVKVTLGGCGG
ncbi:MAG: thiosulfate oxidation carrier protein SoxY [Proteobacteria bacterium]|nr:thiosulfate oxidation carrier protein SoxY [Pseudomonadota bacterium]